MFVDGPIFSFQNDLPEPPFDCKFVSCPFVDLSRFAEYKQTTLETKWNHELLTEPNLGVHVDLIDPDTYRIHDALEVGAKNACKLCIGCVATGTASDRRRTVGR